MDLQICWEYLVFMDFDASKKKQTKQAPTPKRALYVSEDEELVHYHDTVLGRLQL